MKLFIQNDHGKMVEIRETGGIKYPLSNNSSVEPRVRLIQENRIILDENEFYILVYNHSNVNLPTKTYYVSNTDRLSRAFFMNNNLYYTSRLESAKRFKSLTEIFRFCADNIRLAPTFSEQHAGITDIRKIRFA